MWSGKNLKRTRGLFQLDSLQQLGNRNLTISNANANSGGSEILTLKPERAIDVSLISRSRGGGHVSSPVPVAVPQLAPYGGVSRSVRATSAASTPTTNASTPTIAVVPDESKLSVAPFADASVSRSKCSDLKNDDLQDILVIQQTQKAHMELVEKQFITQHEQFCSQQTLMENIRESANQQFHAQQELMKNIRDGSNKQIITLYNKIQQVRNDVSIGFQNLDNKTERNADSIEEVKDEMSMCQLGLEIIDEYTYRKFQEVCESKEKLQLRATLEEKVNMLETKEQLRLNMMTKGVTRTRTTTTSAEHSFKEKLGRGRRPSRKTCMLCKKDFNNKYLKRHKCPVGQPDLLV